MEEGYLNNLINTDGFPKVLPDYHKDTGICLILIPGGGLETPAQIDLNSLEIYDLMKAYEELVSPNKSTNGNLDTSLDSLVDGAMKYAENNGLSIVGAILYNRNMPPYVVRKMETFMELIAEKGIPKESIIIGKDNHSLLYPVRIKSFY